MEPTRDRFKINEYILYKELNEWHEGRIMSIEHEEVSETYNIMSFTTFTQLSLRNPEQILKGSPETRRKMKTHILGDIAGKIHIPVLLKHILVVDREMSLQKPYDLPFRISVSQVTEGFIKYFGENNGTSDEDELNEAYKAFVHSFDLLLPLFLLYDTEKEQYNNIKDKPSNIYGFVHLLRLLYFFQKKGAELAGDSQSKQVVLDYSIYMLDFLMANHKDFN